MVQLLSKIGLITESVKGLEQTETGKFALNVAKVTVVSSLVISGIIAFVVIRSINKTFGATRKDVEIMKSQLSSTRQEIEDKKNI